MKLKKNCIFFFAILLFFTLSGSLVAADPLFSVGTGVEYAKGDFGTDTTTDFISIPLIIDLYPSPKTDIEITASYIHQSDSSKFYGSSMPFRNQYMGGTRSARSAENASGLKGNGSGQGNISGSNTQTSDYDSETKKSVSGLGDTNISAGYVIIVETDRFPQIKPSLFLKIPTADKNKGLGTGEFDAGPGLGISKWIGDWNISAEGKYVFCGSSELYSVKDYMNYIISAGYGFSDNFFCGISGNGATALTDEGTDPFEARLKINLKFNNGTGIESYVAKGLTDGSPDYAASITIFQDF